MNVIVKISPRFKFLAYIDNIGADAGKEAPGSSKENARNRTAEVEWDVSVHQVEAPRPFWDAIDIDEEDKAYEVLSVPKFTANLYCICLNIPQIYT